MIQNKKTIILAILRLMDRLNWRWRGERVTYKMFTKEMNRLIDQMKKSDDKAISVGTGGIEVEKDDDTLIVKFRINIDFLDV